MTPAINFLKKNKCEFKIHKYKHDPKVTNYGLEASEKLNLDANLVYKTLLAQVNQNEFVVAIIPVNKSLNLKALATHFNSKNAKMADKDEAQKVSGYLLGGISAFGQKRRLKTVLDFSAKSYESIYISAGKRGLDLQINPNNIIELLDSSYNNISI